MLWPKHTIKNATSIDDIKDIDVISNDYFKNKYVIFILLIFFVSNFRVEIHISKIDFAVHLQNHNLSIVNNL